MPARQLPRVMSDPPWSPNKLLLLVSLLLALELAGAVGTDHPSNDTHPNNSGGLDVRLDFSRSKYLPAQRNTTHNCTVPFCTVKRSQCAFKKEEYTCSPKEMDCRSDINPRIVCYGYNKGYIQVLEGAMLGVSCVTLEVPADHVAMISFSGVDERSFTMYKNAACKGESKSYFKIASLIEPEVYDLRAISFGIVSKENGESRYNIIYSFHKNTAKPEKQHNGQWNCSVPYLSQFRDHFVCRPIDRCPDSQSIDRCRTDHNICGYSSFWKSFSSGPGRCFHVVIIPFLVFNWIRAKEICSSYFNSRLIAPNSPAFIEDLKSLTDGNGPFFVYNTKQFVPDMYQDTWVWEDNTLTMYSKLRVSNASIARERGQKCSLLTKQDNNYILSPIGCEVLLSGAGVICDISNPALRVGENDVNFLLPTVAIESADELFMIKGLMQMARCEDNHLVHAFQACEATIGCQRTSTKSGRSCADSRFSSPVPFFTCDSKLQDVPYSMVCDFREDCSDGSDEQFCRYRPCTPFNEFSCSNKQCAGHLKLCDRVSDCYDGSDEDVCLYKIYPGLDNIEPPAIVDWMSNYWQIARLQDLNFSCPTTHFYCHEYKVCLPVYLLCNGVNDCPDKQDETGCDRFRCPGFYRCRSSRICLHLDHLCDGVVQCPQRDDELMCDARPCPDACVCYGYAFTCTDKFEARWHRDLRYLDASGSGMTLAAVSIGNTLLIHLSLRHCGISSIGEVDLPNLQRLDLSHNLLNVIAAWELNQLSNLRCLSLAYNPASLRLAFLSDVFPLIRELNFAGLNIPLLNETFALTFPNTEELNLSDSGLTLLPKSGFPSFKHLRVLDIRKCQLQTVFSGLFEGLVALETIYADDFKICCPSALPADFNPKNCHAPIDEVSSCDALLRSETFRVFLVFYALFSLLGNLGSFVYRVFVDKSNVAMGFDVFVTHLSVADFLMGVYLAIIGVADRIFYGDYVWYDTEWRHSTPCLIAGFLSFLSNEVSVFLVCLITLERLLVIRFPMKNLRFSRRTTHIICVALWIAGVTLSAVPLFPALKHWEFYSQYGICIPLPITRKTFPGMDYTFGVMICLNFVVFVFIAVGQGLIYVSFRSNAMTASRMSVKSKDKTIASRLLAVVLTDFLCWFPIGLLGILARSDVPIPGEVNVGMAIFVLPFNSALNPILYTVLVALERRRKTRERCLANAKKKARLSKPQVLESIDTWLTEQVISLYDLHNYGKKRKSEQNLQA